MKIRIFIVLLFLSIQSSAQNTLVKQWDYGYGGMGGESIAKILPTREGGFIVAGTSNSDSAYEVSSNAYDTLAVNPLPPTSDVWLIKCDANGIKQWDKRLGGINNDSPTDIIETADSNIFLSPLPYLLSAMTLPLVDMV